MKKKIGKPLAFPTINSFIEEMPGPWVGKKCHSNPKIIFFFFYVNSYSPSGQDSGSSTQPTSPPPLVNYHPNNWVKPQYRYGIQCSYGKINLFFKSKNIICPALKRQPTLPPPSPPPCPAPPRNTSRAKPGFRCRGSKPLLLLWLLRSPIYLVRLIIHLHLSSIAVTQEGLIWLN